MKLWILSDLHVELTKDWDIPGPDERPDFDVLIVAGDLMPNMDRGVRWLAKRVTDRPVVYLAGNHEGYGTDIDRTYEKAKDAARGTNIIVMENETVVIEGLRVIAGTLWTDFAFFDDPETAMHIAGSRMNDYRRIMTDNFSRKLRPFDTLARHQATRAYIDGELAHNFSGPTVVATHHAPNGIGACRLGHERDIISAAYVSDLTELIERRQPDLWIYGHTHQSDYTTIGSTSIVSNAKGYGPYPEFGMRTWENLFFDPMFTIEIETESEAP